MRTIVGENSRKMMITLRNLKDDNSNNISRSQRYIVSNIARFLELYSRPIEYDSKNSFLRVLEKHVADVYKSRQTERFGTSSGTSNECIMENELSDLKETLRRMGAQKCDLKFAKIIGTYLLRKEISQEDWF